MKKIEIIPLVMKKSERRGIPEEWVIETMSSPAQIVNSMAVARLPIENI